MLMCDFLLTREMANALERETKHYVPVAAPDPVTSGESIWNKDKSHYNCYSYALRLDDLGIGIPGRLKFKKSLLYTRHLDYLYAKSGLPRVAPAYIRSARSLEKSILYDGLKQIRAHEDNPENTHIIASVIDLKDDFHFYSLDKDGHWSHKIGGGYVERVNSKLSDPATQLLNSEYNTLVGFFKVPEDGIEYTARLNVPEANLY